MDLQGSQAQRELCDRTLAMARGWAEEAAKLAYEANGIIAGQYHGLVEMVQEDATPEELATLADIWAESTRVIDGCVDAVASARQEIASIEAMGEDIARVDDAWIAHRAANVARSLVRTKSLYLKMAEQSEEYNRICASIRLRNHPNRPDDWHFPEAPSADAEATE